MDSHDHLIALLGRLKLTALRDQLDSLIDVTLTQESPPGKKRVFPARS